MVGNYQAYRLEVGKNVSIRYQNPGIVYKAVGLGLGLGLGLDKGWDRVIVMYLIKHWRANQLLRPTDQLLLYTQK